MTRVYHPTPLKSSDIVTLENKPFHHLVHVLRFQAGDRLTVFNGEGGEYAAEVLSIKKRSLTIKIDEFNPRETESPCQIHLGQAISKGDKMDITLQ